MITFVTGCSGTGKAELAEILRDRAANVVELNEHPSGMPAAGHIDWLHWVAAECLADAADRHYDNQIVVGTVVPFRLIDSLSWRDHHVEAGPRFVLIDTPWDTIKATLTARLSEAGATADDITEQVENDRRLQRALHYQVEALAGGVRWENGDLFELADYLAEG